jgi:hypothetical protein
MKERSQARRAARGRRADPPAPGGAGGFHRRLWMRIRASRVIGLLAGPSTRTESAAAPPAEIGSFVFRPTQGGVAIKVAGARIAAMTRRQLAKVAAALDLAADHPARTAVAVRGGLVEVERTGAGVALQVNGYRQQIAPPVARHLAAHLRGLGAKAPPR